MGGLSRGQAPVTPAGKALRATRTGTPPQRPSRPGRSRSPMAARQLPTTGRGRLYRSQPPPKRSRNVRANDSTLIDLAYASPQNFHVHGNTLAVAGTQINPDNPTGISGTISDIASDLFLVPTNETEHMQRYRTITREIHDNPEIDTILGHSLGSSVAHQWVSDHPDWHGRVRLYNSPEISWTHSDPRVSSYRYYGDGISLLDRAADDSWGGLGNPHRYSS